MEKVKTFVETDNRVATIETDDNTQKFIKNVYMRVPTLSKVEMKIDGKLLYDFELNKDSVAKLENENLLIDKNKKFEISVANRKFEQYKQKMSGSKTNNNWHVTSFCYNEEHKKFAIIISYNSNNNKIIIINEETNEVLLEKTLESNMNYPKISFIKNGNVVVFYIEDNVIKYKVYNLDGDIVEEKTTSISADILFNVYYKDNKIFVSHSRNSQDPYVSVFDYETLNLIKSYIHLTTNDIGLKSEVYYYKNKLYYIGVYNDSYWIFSLDIHTFEVSSTISGNNRYNPALSFLDEYLLISTYYSNKTYVSYYNLEKGFIEKTLEISTNQRFEAPDSNGFNTALFLYNDDQYNPPVLFEFKKDFTYSTKKLSDIGNDFNFNVFGYKKSNNNIYMIGERDNYFRIYQFGVNYYKPFIKVDGVEVTDD